jgi:RNA-splicing ligase RtcB
MEKKFTKREVLEALAKGVQTGDYGDITVEDIVAYCENEIELLDKKAVKAKERQAAKKAEGDALTDAVKEALSTEFETRDVIALRVAETFGEEATVAKVGYRISQLVKEGIAVAEDMKIPATETTKARTVKSYKLA